MLEEQDRARWNLRQMAEALPLGQIAAAKARIIRCTRSNRCWHCKAAHPEQTDWAAKSKLYDELKSIHPSPVIALTTQLRLQW